MTQFIDTIINDAIKTRESVSDRSVYQPLQPQKQLQLQKPESIQSGLYNAIISMMGTKVISTEETNTPFKKDKGIKGYLSDTIHVQEQKSTQNVIEKIAGLLDDSTRLVPPTNLKTLKIDDSKKLEIEA